MITIRLVTLFFLRPLPVASPSVHTLWGLTYFRRMGADRETARDLSQETFVRALRAASRFEGTAPVAAWLLGIARNVFHEWLRRARREVPSTEFVVNMPGEPASSSLDVERAMRRLSPDHREVLVLRFSLDLPGEEVARILGVSHDVVRQRVARAKAAFREVWGS